MTFNVPGKFKDVFKGTEVESPFELTLAPGEFIVLTK